MAITRLSGSMPTAAVRALSGHSSRAIEVYQHVVTDDVADRYQEAMADNANRGQRHELHERADHLEDRI